ncbi:hypothetical protein F5X68DRAFT_19616 [Plectosphaerella plurivora]|uniref:SUZ domain-containing protein n=1 Tax=Plectosphaerella plurivora TaxID=936078 RepID=A0A9P9A7E3_9PEZI|nr:hypothetical protein F5X68DRAFT_19616 [Plectosphaerella plurivora]
MGKKGPVPDAWEDDDWESLADKQDKAPVPDPQQPTKPLTQRERLVQHAERNRKLWEEAQAPETNHYVEATSNIPLASTFKPQVKVLSRKPAPSIARRDPVTGALSQLSLEDDQDDGQEKPVQLTPEEIRAKQQREREEKQRRYDEVRAKIFGESAPSSGASSPGAVTPPRSNSGTGGYQNQRGRGRGRGRGAQSGGGRPQQQYQNPQPQQQQQFGGDLRRPGSGNESRGLYDPNASTKPSRRGFDSAPASGRTSPKEQQDAARPAIRTPRGPDGSGRGGFGFARRGGQGAD